jgi:hypothetical protein
MTAAVTIVATEAPENTAVAIVVTMTDGGIR